MRDRARVVIIGAGIVGCAAAYYLTRMGWRDIVVVEQGPLFETGGSTTHAPGLVFQTNPSKTMAEFGKQTVELYSSLSVDGQPAWRPVGSLEAAWTVERLEELKRRAGFARSWGIEAEVISASEARERLPLLTASTHGALYVPSDGIAKATLAAEAVSRYSQSNGASFHANTRVTGIEVAGGRVRAVQTDRGRIETDTVLAAAGIWGPTIGGMAGVAVPLYPMQHLLAWTAPLPELKGETEEATHPILRHQDRAVYFRQRGEAYAIGSYQHEPLLTEPDDILSHEAAPEMPSVVPWTPLHFESALESAAELLPPLRGVELVHKLNGMFSFTTDAMPLLGESPEVKGFWSAQAVWITHAGGVAKAVAEWMVEGSTSVDVREADVARFHSHAVSRPYVRTRAAQQYREVYDIKHPLEPVTEPRGLRLSPFHRRQEELGAVFFESAGWERPQWYDGQRQPPVAGLASAVRMGGAVLVAGLRRRARGRQGRRGHVRPDALRQAGGRRVGRPGVPAIRRRQPDGQARGEDHLYLDAQRARRHQVRPHGDEAGAPALPGHHRGCHGAAGPVMDADAPSERRLSRHHRRHIQPLQHRAVGPQRQGAPAQGHYQ